jgi:hypothetical protein
MYRIAPLPPHWVVNIVAPHLGIGLITFWVSTFFGIMGVTVIHTTVGGEFHNHQTKHTLCFASDAVFSCQSGGLDEMTSARDFKLISWKNGLGLSGIVVAVLIPVGIRYYFRSDIAAIEDVEREDQDEIDPQSADGVRGGGHEIPLGGVFVQSGGPPRSPANATGPLILLENDDDEETEDAALQGIETDELPGSDKPRQTIDYKTVVHRTFSI